MWSGFGSTSQSQNPPSFGGQQPQPTQAQPSAGAFGGPSFGSTPQSVGTFGLAGTGAASGGQQGGFGFGGTTTTGFGGMQPKQATPFPGTVTGSTPTSMFGASTAAPMTSAGGSSSFGFGAPTTTLPSVGGFGSSLPSSGFGAPATTSLFGQSTTQPPQQTGSSIFGAAPSTGFGTGVTTSPSPFGGSTTGLGSNLTGGSSSLFGGSMSSSTPAFGGFGASTSVSTTPFGAGSVATGTGNPKYSNFQERDSVSGLMNTFHSIGAMPAYSKKSNEELRWEDYQQNRKGAPGFGSSTQGIFGSSPSTTPSTNVFGGQPASSGFGSGPFTTTQSQTQSPFGGFASSTSTPGTALPATGSLFGNAPPAPGASSFGSSSTGLFGAAPSTGLFGGTTSTMPQPAFGFSGSSSTTPTANTGFASSSSMFGQKPTGTTTLFGTGAQGASSVSSLGQGSSVASPFGAGFGTSAIPPTPPSLGGGFAAGMTTNTPATGLFGSSGSAAPSTSIFATAPALRRTASFGAPASSMTGATPFGTTPLSTNTTGSLFSQPTSSTPSVGSNLFSSMGQQPISASMTNTPLFGGQLSFTQPPQSKPTLSFPTFPTPTPYGNTGLTNLASPNISSSTPIPSSNSALQATIDSKPYGAQPLFQNLVASPATSSLSENKVPATPIAPAIIEEAKKSTNLVQYRVTPRSATKVKPRGMTPSSSSKLELFSDLRKEEGDVPLGPEAFVPRRQNIKKLQIDEDTYSKEIKTQPGTRHWREAGYSPREFSSPQLTPIKENELKPLGSIEEQSNKQRVFLSDSSYFTLPPLEELNSKPDENLKRVSNFIIGKEKTGSLQFLEPVDLRGLDLCSVVIFSEKEVTVYPDESTKAPVGSGLNQPAIVKLHHCWPIDKSTRKPILDQANERLQRHIQKLRQVPNTEFIDYISQDGTWVFKVQHFSRYGLYENSENEEDVPIEQKPLKDGFDYVDTKPTQILESPTSTFQFQNQDLELEIDEPRQTPKDGQRTTLFFDGAEPSFICSDEESQIKSPKLQTHLGLSARKLQTMRASLFGDDYFCEPREPTPTRDVKFQDVSSEDSSLQNEEEPMDKSSETVGLSYPVSGNNLRRPLLYCPLDMSVTLNRDDYVADAGLHLGRTFRPGWGPAQQLVTCFNDSPSCCPIGMISISRFVITDRKSVELLFIDAPHHKIETSGGFPKAARQQVAFGSILNDSKTVDVNERVCFLLKLGSVLWDQIGVLQFNPPNGLNVEDLTTERLLHLQNLYKKKVLVDLFREIIKRDLSKDDIGTDCMIFTLLASADLSEACKKAIEQMKPRMACLISQAACDMEVREDLARQLQSWKESDCLDYISNELIQICELLSGQIGKLGDSLNWQQALLSCLLYGASADSPLNVGFDLYVQNVFLGTLPPPSESRDQVDESEFDLLYHLIKLYTSRSHLLEIALHPRTLCQDNHSLYMTWILSSILSSLNIRDIGHERTRELLHVSFAAELESLGLWQWGVFVLLHLSNEECRQYCIRELLNRSFGIPDSEKKFSFEEAESFLEQNLQIPSLWIHQAKMTFSRYSGLKDRELKYLMLSGDFGIAFDLFMDHIAAKMILEGRCDSLYDIMVLFKQTDCMDRTGFGEALLLFLKSRRDFLASRDAKESETWVQLRQSFLNVIPRLKLWKSSAILEKKAAWSKMVSEAAEYFREIDEQLQAICPRLNLVLPDDEQLSMIHFLARSHLRTSLPMR